MERLATWQCRWCPPGNEVLAPGAHYFTPEAAEDGLRRHVMTAHAALLWDVTERTSFGHVLEFAPLDA